MITAGRLPKKPRKKSLHPENKLQKSCVLWFRYQLPQYKDLFYSIPNEGSRTNGDNMRKAGMTAGIPDTFLAIPRHGFHGLYIEFKYGKNGLSENQERIIPQLEEQGYYVRVCYTFEEFISLINWYLYKTFK